MNVVCLNEGKRPAPAYCRFYPSFLTNNPRFIRFPVFRHRPSPVSENKRRCRRIVALVLLCIVTEHFTVSRRQSAAVRTDEHLECHLLFFCSRTDSDARYALEHHRRDECLTSAVRTYDRRVVQGVHVDGTPLECVTLLLVHGADGLRDVCAVRLPGRHCTPTSL